MVRQEKRSRERRLEASKISSLGKSQRALEWLGPSRYILAGAGMPMRSKAFLSVSRI